MTIQMVFYTQIGSILAFILSLFALYRLLVSSKDATIETLRQQLSFLESKIKASADDAPDVLMNRIEKRTALLEKELQEAEKEKEPLIAEIDELKKKLANPESSDQQQDLVNQLVAVSQHVALLDAERQQLSRLLSKAEEPYWKFLSNANGELSPGRRAIVGDIVSYLGADKVIRSDPKELMTLFAQLAAETRAAGMHPNVNINGGAFTGLRSVGIINDRDDLTLLGVSIFKSIARELNPADLPLRSA
ncbi:hypothetical protein [Vogesella sp. XCS3]|uniref:hypothetical protein n=1 Tax=Vogesella sp. XCS3 TaxID=2877939 RepID=UPI001D09EB98|nr:hypothetical protein [Vogesella sp. XCS3]UDM17911.1 hypothetical protein LCH97_04405 [Vogesella sp. XCS3]